jgi:hypothetical protein
LKPISFFYHLKPYIPRSLQLYFRRLIAARKLKKYQHCWPIDPDAGQLPDNWKGWPNNKKFTLILQHDVDTQRGYDNVDKLMQIEKEMGVRSLFSFVPERYSVSRTLIKKLTNEGFGVAVHGLKHDGKLFSSKKIFSQRALKINNYLKEWNSVGFTAPSMHHNLEWMHALNIEYSISTFDTDPFEPQPDPVSTIFPFYVRNAKNGNGYIEIPYTLPQDHLLFIILREKNINIWKRKLDWIAEKGGIAVLNTHPDYMDFDSCKTIANEAYPVNLYKELLNYIKEKYENQYWQALPGELSRFWANEGSKKY